jgi:hypothetical protein
MMSARRKIGGLAALVLSLAATAVAAGTGMPLGATSPTPRPIAKRADPSPMQKTLPRAAPRIAPAPGPIRPVTYAKSAPAGLGGAAIKMNRGASSIGGKSFVAPASDLSGSTLRNRQAGKP